MTSSTNKEVLNCTISFSQNSEQQDSTRIKLEFQDREKGTKFIKIEKHDDGNSVQNPSCSHTNSERKDSTRIRLEFGHSNKGIYIKQEKQDDDNSVPQPSCSHLDSERKDSTRIKVEFGNNEKGSKYIKFQQQDDDNSVPEQRENMSITQRQEYTNQIVSPSSFNLPSYRPANVEKILQEKATQTDFPKSNENNTVRENKPENLSYFA